MATTRLRRTFHYPSDNDSDNPPDLDEEHQEALLTSLQTRDEATNALYGRIFLALPVLTSLLYLPTLFTARSFAATFIALVSVAVPGIAAYVLYVHPIKVPGRHGLSSLYVRSGRSEAPGNVKPPERHVIVFGGLLAGMLGIHGVSEWFGGKGEDGWWAGVPAVVFFLTLFVRQQLAPVDLEELRKARYELKGA